jgi:pimeloyl-ACP methyl ester carboxylesterase
VLPRKSLRLFIVTAVVVAAIYLAFLCFLWFRQDLFIYPGLHNRAMSATVPHPAGSEAFRVVAAGANVDAIFMPAAVVAGSRQPVVIFAHGNGEVIDDWVAALDGFRDRGIGVVLVEYPGYGRSTGSPSEASIRSVLDGAYDRIAKDPRVDPTRMFGFGQSLGGGAICLLAQDRPLRALILQSTFTSLDTFAGRYGAPALLLRDHFNSLATVARFAGPVLIIHGRNDRLIPWRQGQDLAQASAHATFRLYTCGHVCWDPAHQPFWQDAVPFLIAAGILAPPDPGVAPAASRGFRNDAVTRHH